LFVDDEIGRLVNVHLLDQLPVQEHRLYVHVMDCPPLLGGKCEQQVYWFNPRNKGEHFIKVHPCCWM
jgi:hypothetical protein